MFHTLVIMKNRVAQSDDEIEGDYRLVGEHKVLNSVDRIVAATPAELAQLQWLYEMDIRRIVVIPPGVDTGKFYPIPQDEALEFIGVPPCNQMLLFVGRIEPLKGLDVLIEAIALMRRDGTLERTPFCLSVIGGDPDVSPELMSAEMTRVQTLLEQYGLEEFVAFLGKRSQDTLPYYYSAAEAVVVPSHYESFGMVALEAMACGTPVVASQIGGLAYLVQDGITGFTVPVDEPQALAERLATLLADEELRSRMSVNSISVAQDYAWEKVVNRLVDVYEELLEGASGKHTGDRTGM